MRYTGDTLFRCSAGGLWRSALLSSQARKQTSNTTEYNEQRTIIDGIKAHLHQGPQQEGKRKKRLRSNEIAPRELRIDIYRIFYSVEEATVFVLAVGHKVHNKLYIRGKEVNL